MANARIEHVTITRAADRVFCAVATEADDGRTFYATVTVTPTGDYAYDTSADWPPGHARVAISDEIYRVDDPRCRLPIGKRSERYV